MKGSKVISTIVAVTLLFSAMVVINQVTDFKFVEGASATTVTLSNDGSTDGLYCGQVIEFKVEDNSLNASARYYVKVWNGTHWRTLDVVTPSNEKSDEYGDLTFTVHVPGWDELAKNPLTGDTDAGLSAGEWNISLFDSSGTWQPDNTINETITIGSLYHARYFNYGSEIDYLIYNKTYGDGNFLIKVYNWTSSGWELEDDEGFDISLFEPDGTLIQATSSYITDGDWDPDVGRSKNNYGNGAGCLENDMWVNITNHADTSLYANVTLPVKLNMTISTTSSPEWGDTIEVSGYLYDGQGNAITDYEVGVYSAIAGSYHLIPAGNTDNTSSLGRYSISVSTGSGTNKDDYAHAGTWYIGTLETGTYRIDETDTPDISNFIPYGTLDVSTKDDAQVKFRNTDDIISGFDQTVNVSVYNSSWMDEYEYQNMQIHVTGLDSYYGCNEYDNDDVILMSNSSTSISNWTDSNEKYCYYEFTWRFNQTGTATIIATYPGNQQAIQKVAGGVSGSDNDDEDLLPDISGSATFSVVSPDDINMIIRGTMVETVQVDETGDLWQNGSDYFIINIYGDSQDEVMNATLEITGCGLDILINESDTVAENQYLTAKPAAGGNYTITIAPKVAGTLTITATNGTDNYTATKDYTITGLSGSVTTSVNDDLEIEVGSTETITATVTNGQYAEVHLTLFDETWTVIGSNPINDTIGDNTAGNGLNGIFEFNPDVEDIDDTIGYIVVAAKAGGYYMYDIVEITPVYDLTVTMTSPTAGNQTLTVGIEQDITVQVTDSEDEVVDDIDTVTGTLTDEEGDTLQTISFTSDGDYWSVTDQIIWFDGTLEITAKNNTNQAQHEGSASFDVELATITYSPGELTCAIGVVNTTIEVTAVDALGDPLPENTRLYLNKNASGTNTNRDYVDLDSDGAGEFIVTALGDYEGTINATLENAYTSDAGNYTNNYLAISFPVFVIEPDTIYIGQSNVIEIWAYMVDEVTAIEGINLSLWGRSIELQGNQPDPVCTDANGKAIFSMEPDASGIINVTICRNVTWSGGVLTWTNDVVTDSYITIDSLSTFSIAVSKSPIYQDETLTVTVTSGTSAVSGVTVTFGEETSITDSDGKATFTVPDPGVESAIYTITAEKAGYITKEKSITVIKKYAISIVAPKEMKAGTEFSLTIIAKGGPLAGATVTIGDTTVTSDGDGKATFTLDTEGDYDVTATYGTYTDGTLTITVVKGTPGFELLTLIVALGVAFILLRRRRK